MAPRTQTKTIGFNTYTLADKKSVAKATQILIDLAIKTRTLTKKDIDFWRTAWQLAINVENPRRSRLMDIYVDTDIDSHLSGAIGNRKIQTLRKSFKIVNAKTKAENPDLTQILETSWFKQFVNLALDSIFYGYSLIEFGNLIADPITGIPMFEEIKLVPREHVVPEYNRIIRDPMDEWKKGYDFTMPPFSDWSIGVGDRKNLGLLLKACPHAISKKNMAAYWDQFGEIFGMPIRIGTTTSRDPKERSKIETMLDEMGAAAWGLFPDGTTIEIKETTRGDAYNVYDKRILLCNAEMSKLITGSTMTMDDGSSKSQGEVHERGFRDLCDQDADFVRDLVNGKLLPFLRIHGFKFDGHRFDWDESIEYTPEEQLSIDELMLNNYEVDPAYFAEKYNIPITGKKQSSGASNFFD